MKQPFRKTAAFSLVELVLAIGVAAFALIAILGTLAVAVKTQQASIRQTTANEIVAAIVADLNAALRLPPGLQGKDPLALHGHWAALQQPDILWFLVDGTFITGSTGQQTAPPNAVFMAAVTYLEPPTETTSLAAITVAWPAPAMPLNLNTGQIDYSEAAGSAQSFSAINR